MRITGTQSTKEGKELHEWPCYARGIKVSNDLCANTEEARNGVEIIF